MSEVTITQLPEDQRLSEGPMPQKQEPLYQLGPNFERIKKDAFNEGVEAAAKKCDESRGEDQTSTWNRACMHNAAIIRALAEK